MSRLFDALKESVHSRQGPTDKAAEEVWETLGIDPVDTPVAADDPDINRSELAPGVTDELAAPFPDEDLLQASDVALDEPPGTAAKVALDPTARLIPHSADPAVAEYYRKLRTKILQQKAERNFGSLVVTSAGPQEGKTVTTLNLGLSFAMLPSFKVLVVDGDVRRGTLGKWLGVDELHSGLGNLIDGSAQLDEVLLKSDDVPMHFIVRGHSTISDLDSSHFARHFQRLTELYDLVLVDSAPVNLIADVQLLAASCDAVLLVARAFSTTQKALEKAVQDLKRFRLIGTVLNCGVGQAYSYRANYS